MINVREGLTSGNTLIDIRTRIDRAKGTMDAIDGMLSFSEGALEFREKLKEYVDIHDMTAATEVFDKHIEATEAPIPLPLEGTVLMLGWLHRYLTEAAKFTDDVIDRLDPDRKIA